MNNFYFEIPGPSGPVRHAFVQLKPEDMAELAHLYPLPPTPDSPEDMVFDVGVVNPAATNRHDLNTWYRPNGVHRWGLFRGLVPKPIADQISTGALSFSVTLGLQIDDDPAHDVREAMLVYSVYDVAYGDVCLVTLVDSRFKKMRGAINQFAPSLHTLWSWDDICSDFSSRSGVDVIVPEPFELELGAADIVSPLIESRAAYVPADLIGGSTCRVPCFTRAGEIKYIKYGSLASLPTPGYQLFAAPTTYIFHGRSWSKLPTSMDETKRFPSFRPSCGNNEVGEESGYCYRDFQSPPVYVSVVSPSDYASMPLGGGTHHVTTYVRSLGGFEDFPIGFRNFCGVQFTKLFKSAYYRRLPGLVDISPDTGADVIWRVTHNNIETIVSFDPWNYFPRAMCNFFGEAYPDIIHTPTGVDLKDMVVPTPNQINGSTKITISNSVLSGVPSDAVYTLDHADATQAGIVSTTTQSFAGEKTFLNDIIVQDLVTIKDDAQLAELRLSDGSNGSSLQRIDVTHPVLGGGTYQRVAFNGFGTGSGQLFVGQGNLWPLTFSSPAYSNVDWFRMYRDGTYFFFPYTQETWVIDWVDPLGNITSLTRYLTNNSYGAYFAGSGYEAQDVTTLDYGYTLSLKGFQTIDGSVSGNVVTGVGGTDALGNVYHKGILTTLGSATGLPPTGPAGGDLTGTYPNPSIANNAVTTSKIADNAVTYGKMQNVTGERLLGNPNPITGAVTEIPLGAGLAFMGGALVATSPPPPPPPPPSDLTYVEGVLPAAVLLGAAWTATGLTLIIPAAGRYLIQGKARLVVVNGAASTTVSCGIFRNGVLLPNSQSMYRNPTVSTNGQVSVALHSLTVFCNVGDTIDLRGYWAEGPPTETYISTGADGQTTLTALRIASV